MSRLEVRLQFPSASPHAVCGLSLIRDRQEADLPSTSRAQFALRHSAHWVADHCLHRLALARDGRLVKQMQLRHRRELNHSLPLDR